MVAVWVWLYEDGDHNTPETLKILCVSFICVLFMSDQLGYHFVQMGQRSKSNLFSLCRGSKYKFWFISWVEFFYDDVKPRNGL